jgi:N-acetylmuramoyl-L-alanine amidase
VAGPPAHGLIDARTRKVLATAQRPEPIGTGPAGDRIEVLVDRQVVLAITDDQVVRTIDVSTGKPSTPTPVGSFNVYAKFPRWWSTPFREWLLWAAPFSGGVAMHEYPDVPPFAASHGCVRVTQYDAHWLFDFASVGTSVHVIARSA